MVDLKIGGDPGNERGYLVVTLETVGGIRSDTTVCGAVDIGTAFVSCSKIGWIASTGTGTVSSFG